MQTLAIRCQYLDEATVLIFLRNLSANLSEKPRKETMKGNSGPLVFILGHMQVHASIVLLRYPFFSTR